MITGRVENRQALVPIIYRLPGQPDLILEPVVDTGFTGELTLPPAAIIAMGLPFAYDEDIKLANDSREQVPVHTATILWQGQERDVRVFATGQRRYSARPCWTAKSWSFSSLTMDWLPLTTSKLCPPVNERKNNKCVCPEYP